MADRRQIEGGERPPFEVLEGEAGVVDDIYSALDIKEPKGAEFRSTIRQILVDVLHDRLDLVDQLLPIIQIDIDPDDYSSTKQPVNGHLELKLGYTGMANYNRLFNKFGEGVGENYYAALWVAMLVGLPARATYDKGMWKRFMKRSPADVFMDEEDMCAEDIVRGHQLRVASRLALDAVFESSADRRNAEFELLEQSKSEIYKMKQDEELAVTRFCKHRDDGRIEPCCTLPSSYGLEYWMAVATPAYPDEMAALLKRVVG